MLDPAAIEAAREAAKQAFRDQFSAIALQSLKAEEQMLRAQAKIRLQKLVAALELDALAPADPFTGIEEQLSEDQQDRYGEFLAQEESEQMHQFNERMAYMELADLQTTFNLTDEQQQKAFEALYDYWETYDATPEGVDVDEKLLESLKTVLSAEQIEIYRKKLAAESDEGPGRTRTRCACWPTRSSVSGK